MDAINDFQRGLLEFRRTLYRPTPKQTVVEWAEANLKLTQRQTEHPGPYSTSVRPYVREPLEAWKDPGVSELTLCWGSQTSKTTTLMAGLAWLIDNEPSPALWLMPTESLARSFSKSRWLPFLEDSPTMVAHFPLDKDKLTNLEQHFDKSTLTFIGSNSPANLSSRPVRVLVGDEIDKFADATSKEADALDLAEQRLKAFSSSKAFFTSTPTTTENRIWQRYLRGDQRRYYIPCPHCRELIRLEWRQIKWDGVKTEDGKYDWAAVRSSAFYECQLCKGKISDAQKVAALRHGKWIAENPNALPSIRSYHLSSLYSPDRKCTWGHLAVAFLEAKQSMMGLQGFINGMLAEPWENQDGTVDRVEVISDSPLNEARRYLTADVQAAAPYFWYVCREWQGGNSRLVAAGHADDFAALRRIQVELGVHDMDVGIDSGFDTQTVYDACAGFSNTSVNPVSYPCGLRYPPEGGLRKPMLIGWMPMKGRETGARFTTRSGSIHPFGVSTSTSMRTDVVQPLLVFDSEHLRDMLSRLRQSSEAGSWAVCSLPIRLQAEGAYCVDPDQYWKHLDSHVLKPTANRAGRIKHVWHKRNHRWPDHLHDCEIMQLAMAMLWGDLRSAQITPETNA
jgi:hypothetical protein